MPSRSAAAVLPLVSIALLHPALRHHTMPAAAASTRALSDLARTPAPKPPIRNEGAPQMIGGLLAQFRPVKSVRELVVLPLDSASKAKALTRPIEMSQRAKELVHLLRSIDTQHVKDDDGLLTGSLHGDHVLMWMREIQSPTPPRIGRPVRPAASEHDTKPGVESLTRFLMTYIAGTFATKAHDRLLLVGSGTKLPRLLPPAFDDGENSDVDKHAVPRPDLLIQSITPSGLLNHIAVIIEGKLPDSSNSNSKSAAQLIINGARAGLSNRDVVEQELLRSASRSMKTQLLSVLSSLGPDDLGLLVRKFMTTKKYSTVVYLVLVHGFEYRFFSMQLDGALLDQFEAQITPAKPVAIHIHELTLRNEDGTEFKGDVTKPTDRAIVFETLDTMMQQSQQQQDDTLRFIEHWDDWIASFLLKHPTVTSIQKAITHK